MQLVIGFDVIRIYCISFFRFFGYVATLVGELHCEMGRQHDRAQGIQRCSANQNVVEDVGVDEDILNE